MTASLNRLSLQKGQDARKQHLQTVFSHRMDTICQTGHIPCCAALLPGAQFEDTTMSVHTGAVDGARELRACCPGASADFWVEAKLVVGMAELIAAEPTVGIDERSSGVPCPNDGVTLGTEFSISTSSCIAASRSLAKRGVPSARLLVNIRSPW